MHVDICLDWGLSSILRLGDGIMGIGAGKRQATASTGVAWLASIASQSKGDS